MIGINGDKNLPSMSCLIFTLQRFCLHFNHFLILSHTLTLIYLVHKVVLVSYGWLSKHIAHHSSLQLFYLTFNMAWARADLLDGSKAKSPLTLVRCEPWLISWKKDFVTIVASCLVKHFFPNSEEELPNTRHTLVFLY